MNITKFREIVTEAATKAGSITKLAKSLNMSDEQLRLFIRGKRDAGPKILKAFGVRKHIIYVPVKSSNPQELYWVKVSKALPDKYMSVLIQSIFCGETMDVAIYNGRGPDGNHRWTCTNVEISHDLITHWAYIPSPES